MNIDPSMSNDQIYDALESHLHLFTGLWFATLTDVNYNLQFTFVLIEVLKTKALLDLASCLKLK